MAKRSRKRVRRSHKKSWLENLFTFPMLAFYLFVLLSAFTIYQITKPVDNVLGTSNPDVSSVHEK